ncbi:MAG TPA: ABC transporter ATP-binding protein [Armatimonadota bacterium]|nr:ABC transporter ATP-binding protein [Armatimonadota bacterium]HQK94067.1 ABC transporter ATP-binding protein [Armatimonadota bacterium]
MIGVQITKKLRDFTLEVAFGLEDTGCVALIGPTGCGKSMTLRCIAGLERPDVGRVEFAGRTLFDSANAVDEPPERRRVGFVFQDYALFPHMTVLENVSYGARALGHSRSAAHRAARDAMALLGIGDLERQRPDRISGGQRQRTALARAVASQAEVLLLDEPMAALDTRTRRRVRFELRSLFRRIRIPSVIVTHDPEDALTLGDLICVLHEGRILQAGTRRELLWRPRSRFLAEFMGLNLLHGRARPISEHLSEVECGGQRFVATGRVDAPACLTVKPSDVWIGREAPGHAGNRVEGTVAGLTYVGQAVRVTVEGAVALHAEVDLDEAEQMQLEPGQTVWASFAPERATCYEETDGWLNSPSSKLRSTSARSSSRDSVWRHSGG